METFVKVCTKSEWITYLKMEDFERLGKAMVNKDVIRVTNLFGMPEFLNAEDIAVIFVSTVESRAAYEVFDKEINAEGEEEDPSWK